MGMLYFKDDEFFEKCKLCGAPRWQASKSNRETRKKFPSQGCINFLSFPDYKDCMPLAVLLNI